ncbi:hypothetical protein [Christiangramia sp. LLG6405-1]|uniref:hypothetical protein n=1 Tax=Christiangramia sp. LLG6405-1 TaxID=3160832 RepID=UPI00386BC392
MRSIKNFLAVFFFFSMLVSCNPEALPENTSNIELVADDTAGENVPIDDKK